jgi:hypothetical protein
MGAEPREKLCAIVKGTVCGSRCQALCVRDYLRRHTDKDHPKNSKQISEYLATLGIKADRKTIYNDSLRLQTDFQEPIEYSYKGNFRTFCVDRIYAIKTR